MKSVLTYLLNLFLNDLKESTLVYDCFAKINHKISTLMTGLKYQNIKNALKDINKSLANLNLQRNEQIQLK